MRNSESRRATQAKYNATEKGKARFKRYAAKPENQKRHRELERSVYLRKKSEGICVKNGCQNEADAGVYCSDHRRYLSQMRVDLAWRKGGS